MHLRLGRMTPVLTPSVPGPGARPAGQRAARQGQRIQKDRWGCVETRLCFPGTSDLETSFRRVATAGMENKFPGGSRLRQQSFGWRDAILRKSYMTGSGIGGRCRIMPPRETVPKPPLSPQQDIVFAALLAAIEKSAEPWASTEEVAAAGGLTFRQTRRSLRRLRVHGRASMVYPATRGRYWAPWDDIIRLDLQLRAWERNKR